MKHAYCLWPLQNPCDKNLQQLRGTVSLYFTQRERERLEQKKKKKIHQNKRKRAT